MCSLKSSGDETKETAMRNWMMMLPLAALLLTLAACAGEDGGGGGGGSDDGSVTFALTDAPSDELSVFQVEVTGLQIFNTAGAPTQVFPQTAGQTTVVNLLRLRGIHHLLGNMQLKPGDYDRIELSFINAVAVDNGANKLTINPATSGTVTIQLQPALRVGQSNLLFEIDFDVNNSVGNLVTGPGGSLTLNPLIIARVDDTPTGGQHIEDFKGVVQAVRPMEMVVTLGAGTVRVILTANTIVEANGTFTSAGSAGFDLTTIVQSGNIVEVDGLFNAAQNSVTATKIELEDGLSGFNGPEAQGLVLSLGTGSFDMLVTESRDSGFVPGTTQTITYTGSTFFKWDDPDAVAASSNLRLGMEVRTTGSTGTPAAAQGVKLRETELRGTITAVNAGALQATMDVARIEGVSVSTFAGFSNPVTLQFFGTMPVSISANSFAEVEGHFDRTTNGFFDVTDGDAHGEDNHTHSLEGNGFSIVSTNPLVLSISGQLESATGVVSITGTVVLAGNVVIIEQNDNADTKVQVTAAALEAGINSGKYVELKAEGPYNAQTNTLTATKIVAEMN
jgi:hypothetical protein